MTWSQMGNAAHKASAQHRAATWRATHLHMHLAPLLQRRCMRAFGGERGGLQVTRRTPTHARSGAQKPRVGHVERREGERCVCRGARCAWRCGVVCRAVQMMVRRGEQTAGACRWRGQQECELECVSQQSRAPPIPARHAVASKSGVETLKIEVLLASFPNAHPTVCHLSPLLRARPNR